MRTHVLNFDTSVIRNFSTRIPHFKGRFKICSPLFDVRLRPSPRAKVFGTVSRPPGNFHPGNRRLSHGSEAPSPLMTLAFWSVLMVVSLWSFGEVNGAVERKTIDTIMRSNSLNESHISDIKAFINERIDAMVASTNVDDLSGPLGDLTETSQMISGRIEDRTAYSDAFAQTIKGSYKKLLARSLAAPDRQLAIILKLQAAIIVARVDNIMMIDDLLGFANDDSEVVRYWAVNGLTMNYVTTFLLGKDVANMAAMEKVVSVLTDVLSRERSGLVISKIAQAVLPNNANCIGLIKACATKRIEQYKAWAVDDEQYDLEILHVIFGIIGNGQLANFKQLETELARCAAELYSSALLRLTTGKFYRTVEKQRVALLTDASQRALINLLIEGEKDFNRVSGRERTAQLAALFDGNWTIESITAVQESLLGPAGPVQRVFKIYPPGQEKIKLATLSEPSAELVARAINLNFINNPKNIIGDDMY